MAKQSGLGQALWFNGVDLSNDVGALSSIHGGPAAMEITGIDKYAFERVGGLIDGAIDFAPWFNAVAAQAHPTLSPLPTTDVHIMHVLAAGAIGTAAACLVGKQGNYDGTRGTDGGLSFAVAAPANGYGLEFGELLTAGKRTDTGATSGAALDFGAANYASVAISDVSVANPTQITTGAAHGLVTGDSVVIAGTNTTASTVGNWPVTVVDATHYTIPVNVTVVTSGVGTMVKTSTTQGLSAYIHTFAFTGTSNTPVIQHSADSGVLDAWATVTGATFAAISAIGAQRIQTALALPVKRFTRLNSVGTFNPSTFAAAVCRHPIGASA